jgi:8-amino-7-oxononanoate synthase
MITDEYARTLASVNDRIRDLKDSGFYTFEMPFTAAPGGRSEIDHREVIMLTSGNYLGLAGHPEINKAVKDALDTYGSGACGARLNNGTTVLHLELEEKLAEWMGTEAAITYSSGYMANLGTISALCDSDTIVITDQINHMSILDGCRLAEGSVKIFAHNSMEKLEYVLQRNADAKKKFVVVDGVFSMDGEIAPLDDIHRLTEQYGAMLMVDEAHGTGFLGENGRGAGEHFGIVPDITMGTFSKTLGGVGGFVTASHDIVEFLRHSAHAYMFNASLPAPTVAGVLKALELMRREPWRTEKLWENTMRFRSGLIRAGFEVLGSVTPVIPILVGDDIAALRMSKELVAEGLYISGAIFPAVPKGRARFRATVTAAMTTEDVDRAVELLADAARRHNVLA